MVALSRFVKLLKFVTIATSYIYFGLKERQSLNKIKINKFKLL